MGIPRSILAVLATSAVLAFLPSCRQLMGNYRYDSTEEDKPAKGSSFRAMSASAAKGTIVGLARQPATTIVLGGAVLWQRPRELIFGNIPGTHEFRYAPDQAPGTDGFEALLDKKDIPTPVGGKLTWLVDGRRFYPEFEREIARA